ncbi:hypothetical protein LCGC14_2397710 [marine sediment metagenome]|uniref:Uncharacterized protein n=1 Tax=marine sediment metagenome TaxID=412755 RepID=A0A0F9BWC9_9ZZZZ
MIYKAIRGFNYERRRFEVGHKISGLPIKAIKQLVAEQVVEAVPDDPVVEETDKKGGEDIDG